MSVTAVVGANWGDEGKGKMTDLLAADARYVVRYQGGSNAGHTIINQYGKFALRLLPSGVFHDTVVNVIGPGVALNGPDLFRELDALAARGVPKPHLRISERAQLVLPYHKLFDALEEQRLGDRKFGSTQSGIAPFYADKAAKLGIQAADLFDRHRLLDRLESSLLPKNVLLEHLYGQTRLHAVDMLEDLLRMGEKLEPYLCDTTELLQRAAAMGEPILVEGQLGALRDPDHGIYPFSTSSSTLAGYASVGAGLPPHAITRITAVTKAYSSSVGEGPFIAEIDGPAACALRERGGDAGEYGVNTGRPRRMGWFDAVATRYGCMLQGATEVSLTNLDVLGFLDWIPVCTAYEIDGIPTGSFPVSARLAQAKPVLEKLPGWKSDITDIREFDRLPREARDYVLYIERSLGVPVRYISVGPDRNQLIKRLA
ncbi:adenylosuccinate synthase [Paenibacillus nasutitermitis]|uniref:Adenylosuccinate synthetase n=1 Tax=Paenibacillus nasutitermitis TaxID=1652958 RepID=A0A916YLT9_9BACL|nr:adenylosuccinate synthase [Paenibacillus nasutitermitis]GGD49891.1 adenylosuccinate synthetase [Paenibacillus nasutitermitis]